MEEWRHGDGALVLTLNGGSSSLKFSLATATTPPRRLGGGDVAGIGSGQATFRCDGEAAQAVNVGDHAQAAELILAWVGGALGRVVVIGHRIVHGGRFSERSRRATPELLSELRQLAPLDPAHLPAELDLVEQLSARLRELPQVLCFDTTFHRTLPRVARLLPIPRRYLVAGVERYGFHGLSYTYLLESLARVAGRYAAQGRVILAHLGAGASLAAVRQGRCLETTMGFTPTSGIMMATRAGDLDPGLLVWLCRQEGLDADALDELVNRRSGLRGVSDQSGDMRELLAREVSDPFAAEAVELFCYQAKKAIGALAAVLGGVDTLVFSGGIGERSAAIRARITRDLEHLGIAIDAQRNEAQAPLISTEAARCAVRVIATDEEAIIAREAFATLTDPSLGDL